MTLISTSQWKYGSVLLALMFAKSPVAIEQQVYSNWHMNKRYLYILHVINKSFRNIIVPRTELFNQIWYSFSSNWQSNITPGSEITGFLGCLSSTFSFKQNVLLLSFRPDLGTAYSTSMARFLFSDNRWQCHRQFDIRRSSGSRSENN